MKILVCIKAVPATTEVETNGQFRLKRDGVKLQLNIADESALETAFMLRNAGDTVTVLTMGPSKIAASLKDLLARGADRAVLLSDPTLAGADTYATAKALAAAATYLGGFDLILCGRRAIDGETGQVPPMLAAMLKMPCITNAEDAEFEGGKLQISRRLERGTAKLKAPLPAVVSICEYSQVLRLAGIMGLRRARDKQVELLTADDIGLSPEDRGLNGSKTKVTAMTAKFPGLRKGPRETDLACFVKNLIGEVAP